LRHGATSGECFAGSFPQGIFGDMGYINRRVAMGGAAIEPETGGFRPLRFDLRFKSKVMQPGGALASHLARKKLVQPVGHIPSMLMGPHAHIAQEGRQD